MRTTINNGGRYEIAAEYPPNLWLTKLGRLEDIEERFGVGLEILLQALTSEEPIWLFYDLEPMQYSGYVHLGGEYVGPDKIRYYLDTDFGHYYLDAFGIEWALSKDGFTYMSPLDVSDIPF